MALRGVFLTSAQPAATARFYRDVAEVSLEKIGTGDRVYWKLDDGVMQLAIHDAQAFASYAFPPSAASNLTHLYFHIADQPAFLARLEALGIVAEGIDDVVVTVLDPDGRRVLFGTA